MSQALYRKWRPARFDDVIGQEHITRTLRNGVASGRIAHAYLFCGPRGTGKTTTARLLAKAVNCLHPDLAQRPCDQCTVCKAISEGRFLDLIEIDAASNTGVDDIRSLRDKVNFSPNEGRFKVYIIDEVHMLSTAAFNALLKTLEEPPPHVKFILATTEEHKVPVTIKSRCQPYNFRLLTTQEITGRLQLLIEREQLKVTDEALNLVARQGAGSLRDAESLLDQLITSPEETITLNRAQTILGTASSESVIRLVAAVIGGEAPAGLQVIHQALGGGVDARQFCRQMVDYLRQLLLLQTAGGTLSLDVPAEQLGQMVAQSQQISRERLVAALKQFNEAALATHSNWQPQLPLELAFIESLPAGTAPPALVLMPEPPAVAPPRPTQPERPARPEPEQLPPPPPPTAVIEKVAPTPPAPSPISGVLTLAAIRANWGNMVVRVGRHDKNLPALLNACKPVGVEGNTIVLGFEYPLLRDKFETKPRSKQIVADAFSEQMQTPCMVRCVINSDYQPVPAGTINPDDFRHLAQELGGQVREG